MHLPAICLDNNRGCNRSLLRRIAQVQHRPLALDVAAGAHVQRVKLHLSVDVFFMTDPSIPQ